MIATASDDGYVCLWNEDGNLLKKFETTPGRLEDFKFDPTGKRLLIGHWSDWCLWDLNGNRCEVLSKEKPFIKTYNEDSSELNQLINLTSTSSEGVYESFIKEKSILLRYSSELISWATSNPSSIIKKEEDACNL